MVLNGTIVTDAGLEHLNNIKNLAAVNLVGTRVTAKGLRELGVALPKCQITPDPGTAATPTTPTPLKPPKQPEDAWLKQVAGMDAAKQVEAVIARLKECNPGFDGALTHHVEGSVVTEVQFLTDKVKDISPLRALLGLERLVCHSGSQSQLTDLTPLKDMKLTFLNWVDGACLLGHTRGRPGAAERHAVDTLVL